MSRPALAPPTHCLTWDIFCHVIDNHGDLGVCWRLACNLAMRGQRVRLWADQPDALRWMAPAGYPGISVQQWAADSAYPRPGDVVVEAFGCQLAAGYAAALAQQAAACQESGLPSPVWINLEYLSAEPYAERNHRLPSPQRMALDGQTTCLTKYFFYPGFTPATGGLLREPALLARQAAFDRSAWLASQQLAWQGERLVSLFCYEPPALAALLSQLRADPAPTRLLVTPGRAQQALAQALKRLAWPAAALHTQAQAGLSFTQLPYLSQTDFDHLLWACDFNFVRGEDSLARALLAARPTAGGQLQAIPFIWQIYPQTDGAHHTKLAAFLGWLAACPGLSAAHQFWNGATDQPTALMPQGHAAQHSAQQARSRLLAQRDLAQQLIDFARAAA